MAAAGCTGASDWLTQYIAHVLPLLNDHLHMLLVEALLGLEARAHGGIGVAKLRHTVALLRRESLAPSRF
jgi:hypothetical protein